MASVFDNEAFRQLMGVATVADKTIERPHMVDAAKYALMQQMKQVGISGTDTMRNARMLSPLRMIGMRLHINDGEQLPFDFIEAHLASGVAIVFIVKDGKPLVIEDDAGLFPSDSLITQLRVLIG